MRHANTRDDGRPDELVLAAVTHIGDELLADSTVAAWAEANMFVPDVADRAVLNDLDLATIRGIDALRAVCWNPHDRLDSTTELVRAGMARRVPPAGLTRLAEHTEDWAGFEHGRIHPLRLVSMRYVEQLDFYENRVAAQLVDCLRAHLSRRIRELTELANGLTSYDEFQQSLRRPQNWRKRERLSTLLAATASETTEAAPLIQESLRELHDVRTKVLALRGSPAYQRANRRVRLPVRLARTNLFSNESRYRRVGTLWESWALYDATARDQQRQVDERFLDGYDAYVAALAMRAFETLGYEPVTPAGPAPRPGVTVRIAAPARELTVTIDGDGAILVSAGPDVLVRILALGHDLSAPAPEPVVLDRVRRLHTAAATNPTPLIVTYPGLRSDRERLTASIRRRLYSIRPRLAGKAATDPFAVIPMTPLEIESVERLARALRWIVLGLPMVTGYPVRVPVAKRTPRPDADWFRTTNKSIELARRPAESELAEFVEVFKQQTHHGRARFDKRHEEFIEGLRASLRTGAAKFDLYTCCPLCGGQATEFEPRRDDTFQCRCLACKTAWWGTRTCANCQERYPILWPGETVGGGRDADALDLALGADILSSPCPAGEPAQRFRCPWCGYCQGSPDCGCAPD